VSGALKMPVTTPVELVRGGMVAGDCKDPGDIVYLLKIGRTGKLGSLNGRVSGCFRSGEI
jgi:hypothetical protein